MYRIIIMVALFGGMVSTVFSQINKKPNFILIVADDLGFADLSLNGSTQISTPK